MPPHINWHIQHTPPIQTTPSNACHVSGVVVVELSVQVWNLSFYFLGQHCTNFWLPIFVVFEIWNLKCCGTKSLRIIKLMILAWKIHNFQISFFVMASIIFISTNFHNFSHAPLIWHHNIFPWCGHDFPLRHPHSQPTLSIKCYQHQYQPPPLLHPQTHRHIASPLMQPHYCYCHQHIHSDPLSFTTANSEHQELAANSQQHFCHQQHHYRYCISAYFNRLQLLSWLILIFECKGNFIFVVCCAIWFWHL